MPLLGFHVKHCMVKALTTIVKANVLKEDKKILHIFFNFIALQQTQTKYRTLVGNKNILPSDTKNKEKSCIGKTVHNNPPLPQISWGEHCVPNLNVPTW